MASAPDRLLRRLEWRLGRRLDGRLQGAYRTVWHGTGLDFTDLRAYTAEDDVRHIDWNVTARLDEPYVRQYTEDRELTAWLVVDRSASMRFGPAEQGKDSVAAELSVSLARLVSQGGNRVGAILYDNDDQRVIPPRGGRDQILRIAGELIRPRAGTAGRTTDLAGMLALAAATTRQRRSLIFVVSDFIGDLGWEKPLAMLTHRHEVVVVRVVDPAELSLPDVGLVLVEDAETGEQVLVDTSDPLLRRRLAEEVDGRESAVATAMRRAGVAAHRITTDQDLLDALLSMTRTSGRVRR
ncbi:DUF58 domain-containing protein [Catenuloplanes atrovinosus]|uniref:Uncharacterized protein (DUF58 family) n=1 Tax=Catenuloplanes atrovinosus TaxID=137266 RepID=A0AAE3YMA3_9ACTN|nr:DUF58 domain-containing protein [Catenuloplanes atrovinosus]MDR7274803.1 uncharacterized protein (DUF58 family) [Catenuloplanes atrovinosus]